MPVPAPIVTGAAVEGAVAASKAAPATRTDTLLAVKIQPPSEQDLQAAFQDTSPIDIASSEGEPSPKPSPKPQQQKQQKKQSLLAAVGTKPAAKATAKTKAKAKVQPAKAKPTPKNQMANKKRRKTP